MNNENIDIFLNYNYFGILSRRHKLITIDVSDEIITEKNLPIRKYIHILLIFIYLCSYIIFPIKNLIKIVYSYLYMCIYIP